nr:reverse transcriptase domain-containing protein [Tanacetum cinerariifolium]
MDQIVRVYAARNVEQKRKFENNPWGNHVQQPPFKRQNVVQAITADSNDARGRAALGGGDGNPDSNVVTGTFLLNNLYAYILFDSRADRSFVSTMFSALIDIPPTVLDISYVVELADG